jgi:hypothetical protein
VKRHDENKWKKIAIRKKAVHALSRRANLICAQREKFSYFLSCVERAVGVEKKKEIIRNFKLT